MELVRWPTPVEGYRDTGEGGLYAFALWETPPEADNCHVDFIPRVDLWDVATGFHGPLAPALREAESDTLKALEEASRIPGYLESAAYAEAGVALSTVNVIVPLGSTGASLYSEEKGEYFSVEGMRDLTPPGCALLATLAAIYGKPTYATFLDT